MKYLLIILIILFNATNNFSAQTIDTMNWDEQTFGPKPKVVNLGGTIENFPTAPEVKTQVKSKSRDKSFNKLWQEGLEKEKGKQQNQQSVRSYTNDELDKMGKINHENTSDNNLFYVYILVFFIVSFLLYYFRVSIKKFLIIFLSKFFNTNSKKKVESIKSLNLKDKLTALKDLENLYSTGVINESEYARLKTEILN
jgi:hypothetical protein